MENLNERVSDVLVGLDEEYVFIESLKDQYHELLEQQVENIQETAKALLPLMKKMQSEGHLFQGEGMDIRNPKGPVLEYDRSENTLTVFNVNNMQPLRINMNTNEEEMISYHTLLDTVDYPSVMRSLNLVLDHHKRAQRDIQELIAVLKEELEEI